MPVDDVLFRIARNAAQLAGKAQRATDIYERESKLASAAARAARLPNAGDNEFDAMRHARASEQLTREVGPEAAALAGYAVEAGGLARNVFRNLGQAVAPHHKGFRDAPPFEAGIASMRMDLHNNAEGRRAALAGRPIDMSRLRMQPDGVSRLNDLYDPPPPPRRHTTAGR